MTYGMSVLVNNSAEMERLGARIAALFRDRGGCVTLVGPLGAGKTTLVRGMLRQLGYQGVVKSPTYTLMEEYALAGRRLFHLDLYRLADAEELEYLGLRDALSDDPLLFVEWPERGRGALPAADLAIIIDYRGEGRRVQLLSATPLPEHEPGSSSVGGEGVLD